MRKTMVIRVLASILTTSSLGVGASDAQENVNHSFNFEGVEAFWDIVAVLGSDREPTEAEWNEFFEAPGYSRLSEEFGRGYFTNAIRAVFLPSRTELAEEMVNDYAERGGFLGWYTPLVLEGFREASTDREWQSSRIEELKTYPYLEKAADYALEYLPEEVASEYPAVNFVVFSDSRGYTPLIMGITGNDTPPADQLACLESQGLDRHFPFMLLMAHESFHMYRGRVEELSLPDSDHPDYPILRTLDQMENEGIGDLIHRKRLYYGDGCLATSERAQGMQHEQLAQPATIRIMDRILSELADNPELTDVLAGQFQSFIPQSGHPAGYFMANLIEEELGADEIRRVVRNPFGFFALYNRAAEQNGHAPMLSAKAMDYLESLERRYVTN